MVALSTRPLVALKHHLPATQLNEAGIERFLFMLVPFAVRIRVDDLLPMSRPERHAIGSPARLEIEDGFTLRSLLQSDNRGRHLVRRQVRCPAELGKVLP